MKNLNEWYSRKYMLFIGFMLFVTGFCVTIVLFPTNFILAFSLFTLIGGLGIFIGYKQKKVRLMLFFGLLIVSWGYAGASLFKSPEVDNTFWGNFLGPTFFLAGLATMPVAWFGRWNPAEYGPLRNFFVTYMLYLCLVIPLVFAFAWDYNIRGDTSPPEVVDLKITAKYIAHHDELPDEAMLDVETLDGRSVFFLHPSESFYDEHGVGDLIEATAHKGALGGTWLESYK